jgi:heme exporter protein D
MNEAFFDMGGYAAYVWPSYALAAVILLFLFFAASKRLSQSAKRLKQLQSLTAPATEKDAS